MTRAEGLLESAGKGFLARIEYLGGLSIQFWRSVRVLARVLPVVGKRLRWRAALAEMVAVGFNALPMVCLMAFCTGLILAFQGGGELKRFGALQYVVSLVAVGMTREAGPLMAAIAVSGRSGSAFSAEIGTMVVTEEISALRTMAIDPVEFLIAPKYLAMLVVMPCLTVAGNIAGILAGGLFMYFSLDMGLIMYLKAAAEALFMRDIISGLIKSVAFGSIIVHVGCYEGLKVEGGPVGVGRATTSAVVRSTFLVILADVLFTAFFYFLW